ncbi:MAG: phosphoribosylanthranilate isomerase [Gemmatimonadales bacterium]
MGVEVKVCGLTRASDARAAALAGARYLGMVRGGGPRRVTDAQALELVLAAAETGRLLFAVYTRQRIEEILRDRELLRFEAVQLHGEYTEREALLLESSGLRVWRVVRLAGADDLDRLDRIRAGSAILIEPRVPGLSGGSGFSLDSGLAQAARARVASRSLVLAGGLTPSTVAAAITAVQPDVVDVSSGVEVRPGIKEPGRVRRFVEAVLGNSPAA